MWWSLQEEWSSSSFQWPFQNGRFRSKCLPWTEVGPLEVSTCKLFSCDHFPHRRHIYMRTFSHEFICGPSCGTYLGSLPFIQEGGVLGKGGPIMDKGWGWFVVVDTFRVQHAEFGRYVLRNTANTIKKNLLLLILFLVCGINTCKWT